MIRNLHDAEPSSLPDRLPIFPLPEVLLLPGGRLPLHIFEARYLAMVEDALAGHRMIGMIQPMGGAKASDDAPPIFPIGGAGRITAFKELDDGRYLITLTGVCRFGVREEVGPCRGYRQVVPDWDRFRDDLDPPPDEPPLDRARLIAGLRLYFESEGISANWDAIQSTSAETLVTSLAMICPFGTQEKQALLEAATLDDRAKLLIGLVEMAAIKPVSTDSMVRH